MSTETQIAQRRRRTLTSLVDLTRKSNDSAQHFSNADIYFNGQIVD